MHPFLVIGSCSSEGLSFVTLGDWHHLGDLGDRGVSRGACQLLWESGEEDCTWLDLHHAGMMNGDS